MYLEALKKADEKLEGKVFLNEYLCCWVISMALLSRALLFICTFTLCFNEYKGMQIKYLGTYFHYN